METAVEWLGFQLNMLFTDITEEQWDKTEKLFQQAKEMEKEQQGYIEEDIALAFNEGQAYSVTGKLVDGKEWVKEHKKEWFEQFKNK